MKQRTKSKHLKTKKGESVMHHLKSATMLILALFFFGTGGIILWSSTIELPDLGNFQARKVVESTKIYDRTGEILLYSVHDEIKRTIVPFEMIPLSLKNASIAAEDARFYTHRGIEPKSILRALLVNLRLKKGIVGQGGSTITQQVIKKTLLTDEKRITRKVKEIILALRLEQEQSKDEILALYLNEIPYGGNIYGIGEASKVFFGKEPSAITLAESAYLAALPNAPTRLSPYGNNRALLDERKDFVLERMRTLSFITEEEYNEAINEKVAFLPKEPRGIKAPHFVEWVKEYLAEEYGERALEEEGFSVITTLDYDLQQKAEEQISAFADKMEQEYGAKNMGLVAIDPRSGQVLAMVGSRDYFDVANEGNFNVTIRPNRQPGSAFKPFAYATAFKKGYTADTVLFDLPTNFSVECDAKGNPIVAGFKKEDCYTPENFEGGYRGPLTLRSSLAQSRNVTSVKTLYLAGIKDTVQTAHDMGITSLNDLSRLGLSLVLGGGEVSVLDITGAYGVFANDGIRNPTTAILRIEDKSGTVVEEFKEDPREALPTEVARTITSILSDNAARTPTFGANSSLYFPGKDVAVKTGTTNDFRDAWTVGYTPSIAVGMWAGNNDNSSIKKGNSAAYTVSLVWHAFMEEAMRKYPPEKFVDPTPIDLTTLPAPLAGVWQGGEKYVIDTVSGKLATEYTPVELRKIVTVPEVHTILHWIDKNDPRGDIPAQPQNDSQYNLWEIPVREWAVKQGIMEGDRSGIPTEYDTIHTASSAISFSVVGTDPTIVHTQNETLSLTALSTSTSLVRADLFVNNRFIERSTKTPPSFTFTPEGIRMISGENTISIIGYDAALNKGTAEAKLLVE